MTNTDRIDAKAEAMSDDEREAYISERGWTWAGAGHVPPIAAEDTFAGGLGFVMASGLYSLSTAIRECLAREDPTATPNDRGRYYHGEAPAGRHATRW